MIGAIPAIIVDIGALLVFLGVLVSSFKLPPIKWLFGRLVSEPITTWLDERNTKAIKPLRDEFHAHESYVRHHLGPNGDTTPVYERLRAVEKSTSA